MRGDGCLKSHPGSGKVVSAAALACIGLTFWSRWLIRIVYLCTVGGKGSVQDASLHLVLQSWFAMTLLVV